MCSVDQNLTEAATKSMTGIKYRPSGQRATHDQPNSTAACTMHVTPKQLKEKLRSKKMPPIVRRRSSQ